MDIHDALQVLTRMALPNPFRKYDENTRTVWGYTFQWGSPYHMTPTQMQPLKHSYDVLGDEALKRLYEISPVSKSTLPRNTPRGHPASQDKPGAIPAKCPVADMYDLLKKHEGNDPVLNELWTEINTIPSWVDWDQIARGQDMLYRYGGPMLTGLCYQSLLGGMGASRVVETLARTGGFSTKVARQRIYETTQHILQCTQSLEAIQPGGAGHKSSIRVRLLHAAVRSRILKLAEQRPEYFDVDNLGIPINDLDCIGTICTFSATLVWISLPRQGIFLRRQEIEDFIALWRYVAYLTGTPNEYFETPERARATLETLMLHEINPSETSKVLASNVIRSLECQPPSYASREMLEASSRFLNGNDLSDALGLGPSSIYYTMLVAGQCIFFMSICYFYRAIPFLDRRKISALRTLFWKVIVESKHGLTEATYFDFKYIPDFSTRTVREEADRTQPGSLKSKDREEAVKTGVLQPGVERRNLQAFIIGSGIFSILAYFFLRLCIFVVQRVGIARGPLLHAAVSC